MKISKNIILLLSVLILAGCGGNAKSSKNALSSSNGNTVVSSSTIVKPSSSSSENTPNSATSSKDKEQSTSSSSVIVSSSIKESSSVVVSSSSQLKVKVDPIVTFSIENGAEIVLGESEMPTVSVTEGLNYSVYYTLDGEPCGVTLPNVAGTYSMVVEVKENEDYNSYMTSVTFTLIVPAPKADPIVTFSINHGEFLVIGESEMPTVTVDNDLEYTIHYETDEGFFGNECPTDIGTYYMVVNVVGNSEFNNSTQYLEFTLVKQFTVNGVLYRTNSNKTLTVTGYNEELPNEVTIPGSVEGFSVDEIGVGAFRNSTLTSLVVSEGITRINDQAFHSCKSLASVALPSSLTYIGKQAFYICTFQNIELPSALTYLGQQALRGNKKLETVTFENNVSNLETIDDGAFYTCSGLVEFTIPASVTYIGKEVFLGCTKLTSIDIPSTVLYMGSKAFSKCSATLIINCAAETQPEGWDENWSVDDKGVTFTINWGM